MYCYRLTIEYNGKNFCGSQIQKNLRTVEGVLRDTLKNLLRENFELEIASRTDSGVHALGNVVKLLINKNLEIDFKKKLNYFLPDDLKVIKLEKIKKNCFNIKRPKYKVYSYIIYNSESVPTIIKDNCCWIKEKINMVLLRQICKFFSSLKKFSFATTKDYVKTNKSTVCDLKISVNKIQNFIILKFIGKKFIHKLIRNLVSLIIDVSVGKLTTEEVKIITKSWEWFKRKPADPKALYLVKIIF